MLVVVKLGDDWCGWVTSYTIKSLARLYEEAEHDSFLLIEDGSPDGFLLIDVSAAEGHPTATTGRVRWLPGLAGTSDHAHDLCEEDRKAIFERICDLYDDGLRTLGPNIIRPWED